MIIRCPQCKTGYNVPDNSIGADGRTVRCTQCGHEWHAMPEVKQDEESAAQEEKIAPPLPPRPESFNESIEKSLLAEKAASNQMVKKALLTALAIIFMAGAFFGLSQNLFFSGEEQSNMRDASRGQKQLHIDGLEIPEDSIERTLTEGRPTTLTFTGKIVNNTGASLRVPKIIVSLHDEKGIEIDRWPAYVSSPTLGPNEEAKWVCRFFDPELENISEHRVRFVEKH